MLFVLFARMVRKSGSVLSVTQGCSTTPHILVAIVFFALIINKLCHALIVNK